MHVFLRLRVGVTQMVSYLRSREYDRWRERVREESRKQEKRRKGPGNCCNWETKRTVSRARNQESQQSDWAKWLKPWRCWLPPSYHMPNLKALPFILLNILQAERYLSPDEPSGSKRYRSSTLVLPMRCFKVLDESQWDTISPDPRVSSPDPFKKMKMGSTASHYWLFTLGDKEILGLHAKYVAKGSKFYTLSNVTQSQFYLYKPAFKSYLPNVKLKKIV